MQGLLSQPTMKPCSAWVSSVSSFLCTLTAINFEQVDQVDTGVIHVDNRQQLSKEQKKKKAQEKCSTDHSMLYECTLKKNVLIFSGSYLVMTSCCEDNSISLHLPPLYHSSLLPIKTGESCLSEEQHLEVKSICINALSYYTIC